MNRLNPINILRRLRLEWEFFCKDGVIYESDYKGFTFHYRSGSDDMEIVKEVFDGCYSIEIKGKNIAIDIGGHIGSFSIMNSSKFNQIYTFEPNEESYELLRANLYLNKIKNVKTSMKAIYKEKCKKRLSISPYSTGASGIVGNEPTRSVEVQCITLQSFMDKKKIKKIDLLKIDCEGSEYDILNNLPLDYFKKIGNIVMECHQQGENDITTMKRLLEKRGYKLKIKTSDPPNYYLYAKK